jgi:VWFA-related protein
MRAILLALALLAQDDVPTFRTEVNLVRVDAQVTDANGGDISGLRQQDFVVYDEGERREVMHFGRESESLDLVLVVDVSGSMWRYLRDLSTTTATTLEQLRPSDRVALELFASRPEVTVPFTTEFRKIETALVGSMYKQTLGRGTALNEALLTAAEYLKDNSAKGTRRAILIVTDNEGSRAGVTDEQVVRAVSGADSVLNAIVVGAPEDQIRARYVDPNAPKAPDVFRFAKQSGGEAVTSDRVADALKNTVAELRTRYALQYSAPPGVETGKQRRIRMELSPEARRKYPGAVIRARESYYVQ